MEICELSRDIGKDIPNLASHALSQKYVVNIHAILWSLEGLEDGSRFFVLELNNLATESITSALNKRRSAWDPDNLLVAQTTPFVLDKNRSEDPEVLYERYREQLWALCEEAKEKGRTLVLGFSSMGWYELLPKLSKVLKQLKSEYDHLICIIWGSDFNALPEKEFMEKAFSCGMDIVNIGGAAEFVDFFGSLGNGDSFYRDEEGFLRINTDRHVPGNLLFAYQKAEAGMVPGKKIETTSYYNRLFKNFHFAINNNPCLNNCGYCANFIHESVALKDADTERAIKDFNERIVLIEDEVITVSIDNPNPMQYVDKFERFLLSIDLSKVLEIGFFGDYLWMWNEKVFAKVTSLMDSLLAKWPTLHVAIHFWIDALHHDRDGEFIGRTLGLKVADESKFEKSLESFRAFYQKYFDNPRVAIPFNMVFHPNMDLGSYRERLEFIEKYDWKSNWFGLYPLVPHVNTRIWKDHKGFYIPESEAANAVDFFLPEFKNINLWWHFYLKSNLLDCYIFSRHTGLAGAFEWIANSKSDKIEEFKENAFLYFLKWCLRGIENILKNSNSLFWRLRYKKRRMDLEGVKSVIDYSIWYIDFMIYREKYIAWINPDYQCQELESFLGILEDAKGQFSKLKERVV